MFFPYPFVRPEDAGCFQGIETRVTLVSNRLALASTGLKFKADSGTRVLLEDEQVFRQLVHEDIDES